MEEKIAQKRLMAAKQGRFVRFPYGTFVILLVDSIINYRFTGNREKSSLRNNLSTLRNNTKTKHTISQGKRFAIRRNSGRGRGI